MADDVSHGLVLPNWEFGSDVAKLVDTAVAAEESGWDGVFLADHLIFPPPERIGSDSPPGAHLPLPDPWIALAGVASRTNRVSLGSWVTPVARRQPWQVARDLATLDRMSGGRCCSGWGSGDARTTSDSVDRGTSGTSLDEPTKRST